MSGAAPAKPGFDQQGEASDEARVGAALDPCAAVHVPFDLGAGEEREFLFTLGVGRDADDAIPLLWRDRR